jgi:heme A synthase
LDVLSDWFWAVGFLYFFARNQIPKGWVGRLLLVGAMGGLQGAIGWWMVSSGLSGRMLDVASYRLATHLGLAFVILDAWCGSHGNCIAQRKSWFRHGAIKKILL